MQAELDRRREEEAEERRREEEEVRGRSVREFELLQMGLEVGGGGGRKGRAVDEVEQEQEEEEEGVVGEMEGRGGAGEKKNKKRKFELDEEELLRIAREERTKARLLLNDEKVSSSPRLPLPMIAII